MGVVFGKITVETPVHTVVHKAPTYEIRRYPPCIAATVHAKDLQLQNNPSEGDFTNAAFRALARYIGVFGAPQNRGAEQAEPIAMTAPVEMKGTEIRMTAPVEQQLAVSGMTMSFFLPAKYTSLDETPTPTDPAVKLMLIPRRYRAVATFSGNLDAASSARKANVLLRQISVDGFEVDGDWSFAGYNPPFTLPWLKRNEVHVPVDGTRFDGATGVAE